MPERSMDWLMQAEKDLQTATLDLTNGFFEWACFTAQQASEKAVKAVFQRLHGDAWGHGIKALLENLPFEDRSELMEDAVFLDKMYIPTRYPNGLPHGIPHDYFTEKEAWQAVRAGERIYEWCKGKISEGG
ncbi:MAG TPA: HEPN domain-containing protein [Thermodesulfobacteriota bacterium]|nr:HEPN domain-containing protein [Thermodesulfobacteriota bacterium]